MPRWGLSGAAESAGIAVLAALVLLPPTVLLGTTVPLAVEFLARAGTDVRAGFGRLYLLNTLGGALGVALAGALLWFAPHLIPEGWAGSYRYGPEGCPITVFHGSPKPHEVHDPDWR